MNRPRDHTHSPRRPLWICRRRAQSWPCGQAKLDLLRDLGDEPVCLRIFLASCMHEALRDLHALTPNELPTPAEIWTRFLSWAAPPTPDRPPQTAPEAPRAGPATPPRFRTLPPRRSI